MHYFWKRIAYIVTEFQDIQFITNLFGADMKDSSSWGATLSLFRALIASDVCACPTQEKIMKLAPTFQSHTIPFVIPDRVEFSGTSHTKIVHIVTYSNAYMPTCTSNTSVCGLDSPCRVFDSSCSFTCHSLLCVLTLPNRIEFLHS